MAKKHNKKISTSKNTSFKENAEKFYSRFKNPLKWKILTALLVIAVALNIINKLSDNSTEDTTTTDVIEISDDNTYEELNAFIEKMSIVTGSNDDTEAALAWLGDNQAYYQDTLHRSKKMLYLDLVSATRGNFTEETAQYALENCSYDYKTSAIYWADTLTTTGLSKDEVKTELATLQRYGGFTSDEIEYAVNNITATVQDTSEERQYRQYIEALSKDTYSNGTNLDKKAISDIVDTWLNDAGYSQEQMVYNLTTYCNFDYDVVNDAILDKNVDWGLQAQRVLKRFANTEMNTTSLEDFLQVVNGYPQGETLWAIKHI